MFYILLLLFCLIPSHAFAWGPGTHLTLGLQMMDHLGELPSWISTIMSTQSLSYLYGCVGADIVLAKKFGKESTHCHRWENAFKLIEHADTDSEMAFALGYLSHLAADTESHNAYVPSKVVASYNSKAAFLNHMYWELRFDRQITRPEVMKLFKVIATENFEHCDNLFQRVIETRILGFTFNKHVFDRILILQGLDTWQAMLNKLDQSGTKPLSEACVSEFRTRASTAMRSLLSMNEHAKVRYVDPIGQHRQMQSQQTRRWLKSQMGKIKDHHLEHTAMALSNVFLIDTHETISDELLYPTIENQS